MKTKEMFNLRDLSVRPFDDAPGLINALRRNRIVGCWGGEKWTLVSTDGTGEVKAIRFKSNGYLHKGLVYITVNGSDLFDVYLTTLEGRLKKVDKDIFIEDLIERIDLLVETKRKG